MVRPNLKARGVEHRFQILEEKFVLKNSARKHDRIGLVRAAERSDRVKNALRNSSLKCARTFACIAP